MPINQRDIVELNFLMPDGKSKPHPAIVISNNDLFEDEGFFYCCMISTKNYNPQYTFEIYDTMLLRPMVNKSYVKCQIIGGFTERDILKKHTSMRTEPFEKLLEKLISSIF
jgi:mRNA-degrading endonuclease toxin of MazEF toxin-antitoxin module